MLQPFVTRLNGTIQVVAGLVVAGLFGTSANAASTITGLSTTQFTGTVQNVNNVNGAGHQADFPEHEEYDLRYTGETTRVNSITTGLGTFSPTSQANYVFRRTNTPNSDIAWFHASHNTTTDQVTLYGPKPTTLSDLFGGNNLNVGVDNMFANGTDGNGNYSNIERVDFVFSGGLTSASSKGFAVIERGNVGDHDAFGIVAITSISQDGTPTAYGTIKKFGTGDWGNTALLGGKKDYVVVRKDNDEGATVFAPSAHVKNSLGGVFVPLTDLAAAGTTIYGFSLVGGDVNASGSNLVNWSNTTYFPGNTLNDNDSRDAYGNLINTSPGGLDPTGTLAMLYSINAPVSPVPEPSSIAMIAMAAFPLLARRRK